MNKINTSNALRCLGCSGEWLHTTNTVIAGRSEQDGQVTLAEVSTAAEVTVRAASEPVAWAGRRNAVSIELSCEECGTVSILRVVQHKGQTYLDTASYDNGVSFFETTHTTAT